MEWSPRGSLRGASNPFFESKYQDIHCPAASLTHSNIAEGPSDPDKYIWRIWKMHWCIVTCSDKVSISVTWPKCRAGRINARDIEVIG